MPDESPSTLAERLIDLLEEAQRGPLASVANENAIRNAKACAGWIATHQERQATLARAAAAPRSAP